GSNSAASLELATGGEPVMAIGGFDNEGGRLTLAQFKADVARGEIHYYIASSSGGPGGAGTGAAGRSFARPGTGAARSGAAPSGGPTGAASRTGAPPGGTASPTGAAPGGAGFAGGAQGGSSTSAITSWVKAHYKAVTIGGQTVYDLTS
ncbi:MAG: hypothetical protein ABSH51_32290, partial [Solirubrobacteraceae bacterium]